MPSTFTSPAVGSAYYYRRSGSARTVCRSTGFSLLSSIQATVLELLQDVGPLPAAGGGSISADQVQVIDMSSVASGPGWDDMTLRGIWAFIAYSARGRSAITAYLPDISADIMRRSGRMSERTMKAAIWLISSRGFDTGGARVYGIGSPDDISFPAGTEFPLYSQIPPLPSNWTLQSGAGDCTPIAEGDTAGDPVTTTATLGVSPLLMLALGAAAIVGFASATKSETRKNPVRWFGWHSEKRHARTAQKRAS